MIENDQTDSDKRIPAEDHTPAERRLADDERSPTGEAVDWQEMALRLQAEMENFRKRQLRLADEATAAEKTRLLKLILPVVDNLERALDHQGENNETTHRGLELTYRELMRLLQAEGVTRLETVGHPFDPTWHEAIATVPAPGEAGTIVEELEAGYKLGDKLLRPARVVIAA